jgi:hypothetical protein
MISLNKLLTVLLCFRSSDVFALLAAGVAGVGTTAMANETESILLDDYGHICGGLPDWNRLMRISHQIRAGNWAFNYY